jgi:hypothetical protein
MNKAILYQLLFATIILGGCKCKPKTDVSHITKQQILAICITDQSLSSQYTDRWDSACITNLYNRIALNGGGAIKFFSVLSNSQMQTGTSLKVAALDTLNYKVNIYQKGKAKEKNRNTVESYQTTSSKAISELIAKVIKPQQQKFSDVYGCLRLCQQTALQSNFSDYSTYVIVVSDLLHDQPKSRKSKPVSFQFPDNARILLVRPMLSEKSIKQLFADSQVESSFTSLNDAISIISSQ